MWAVAPQVEASSSQLSSWTVRIMASSVGSGDVLKRSESRRLSQRQKPLRSQYKVFTRMRGLLRKTKSTGSNTATFMSSSTSAARPYGFSEVHGLGVKVDFFDFGVGSHHGVRAPERDREHSIRDQLSALNVGFMERLRSKLERCVEHGYLPIDNNAAEHAIHPFVIG